MTMHGSRYRLSHK